MDIKNLGRGRPILIAFAVTAVIALFAITASMMGVRTAQAAYSGPTSAQSVARDEVNPVNAEPTVGVAFVPEGGVDLFRGPDRDPYFRIHEGLALPYLHRYDNWLLVTTTCNDTAWINVEDVGVQDQATAQSTGTGFEVSSATIVLDPGHGDRDWGGVGPSGLSEKSVNLDIADRVRTLMESSQDVDWDTGTISSGTAVSAFGSVVLTRDVIGPNGGDFEAGLGYRATLGTAAGADVFVSIHNNTVPRIDSDIPGSEVYYSAGVDDSDRLAGLIYEELLRSFAAFDADWTGGELLGARARLDPDTGEDYYGLLRRATMPAVIVEGVYISEPDEEALLDDPNFRQAYAEAVYRGTVRFLSTADSGASVNDPEYFHYDSGTVSGNGCQLPAQPE
ncbi:MAG: N-acetylmuramoyl-L-alanine amidase [bacterium]|nr:N-acetylmuramoyl-L-alanine amidase [bacterium]